MAGVGRDDDDDEALFVKDGAPVKFCFHRSVTQGRGQIARDVERHGGQMVADERGTDVLLVDEQEDLAFIRLRYYSSTELYRLSLYVEPRGFVQDCIRSGSYCHVRPVKKGMPGRAGGPRGGRVPFTEDDRDHLAYYLATRCPTQDGRMGNSAYKDLVRLGESDDPSWAWARRHTFHSWREHYKMNADMMDARIERQLVRLKDIGHHLGHDMRRHDHWDLRQEEEEGDEEEEEEEEEQQQKGAGRRDRGRGAQVRREDVTERRARDYLARHEQDLEVLGEEDGDGAHEEEEIVVEEPQRSKRQRAQRNTHRQRVQEEHAKRARVSHASSSEPRQEADVEAVSDEGNPVRNSASDNAESQEIEGSDLFGDRAYTSGFGVETDDFQGIDFPRSFSPKASSVPERDGVPPLTQQTLVASSPLLAEKDLPVVPSPRRAEPQAPVVNSTAPVGSQQTLVMTQEHTIAQRPRVHVRGSSAQPGPSTSKETQSRVDVAVVEAPYWNTRARSRSVEPQPQPEPQRSRKRGNQQGRRTGKAREEVLVPIGEDVNNEEDTIAEDQELVAVSAGASSRSMAADEMAVEELLEASVRSTVTETGKGEDVHDGINVESDIDSDGDITELPRFQEIEIGDEPSDSDDVETHESLMRGAQPGQGKAQEADGEPEDESVDEDTDRVERMERGSLHAAPVPASPPPRVTRSRAGMQTQTGAQAQTRTHAQTQKQPQSRTSSRRTPHADAQPAGFPSPGTKARAVVDRFREEERQTPYEPPQGSRAAQVVKKGRRK